MYCTVSNLVPRVHWLFGQPVELYWRPPADQKANGLWVRECTVSSNFITNHHRHQKVFGHLTCTSNMSTLRLRVFDSLLGTCYIGLRSFVKLLFWHAVFLNFSNLDLHCLLFTIVFFHAGFRIELNVVVSNVYCFILLFCECINQRRKWRKKYTEAGKENW